MGACGQLPCSPHGQGGSQTYFKGHRSHLLPLLVVPRLQWGEPFSGTFKLQTLAGDHKSNLATTSDDEYFKSRASWVHELFPSVLRQCASEVHIFVAVRAQDLCSHEVLKSKKLTKDLLLFFSPWTLHWQFCENSQNTKQLDG